MCEESLKNCEGFYVGQPVVSTAGHDKNNVYVVYKVNQNDVYVVDGKVKTTANPKRKNYKHLQKLSQFAVQEVEPASLDDLTVKRVIKQYLTKRQK